MAPVTPSNTARAGGILFPITLSVARAFGSEPGPTASLIGSFLLLMLYQGDLIVSAMFLTATAPNPLVAELARQSTGLEVSWTTWALAAAAPGVVALIVIPLAIYRLCPPTLRDTSAAQGLAADRLRAMGAISRDERAMLAIFGDRARAVAVRRVAWSVADDGGVSGAGAAACHARAGLAGSPGRARRVGRADLVRRADHAGGTARQGRPAESVRGRGGERGGRMAVVVGARRAARRVSLRALRVRDAGVARHRDVPRVLRRRRRPWRAAAAWPR